MRHFAMRDFGWAVCAAAGLISLGQPGDALARASGLYSFEQYFPQSAGYPAAPAAPSAVPSAAPAPAIPARAPAAAPPAYPPMAAPAQVVPPATMAQRQAAPAPAQQRSQPDDDDFAMSGSLAGGWYVGLGGGMATIWDKTDNLPGAPGRDSANFVTSYKSGFFGSISGGYSFGRSSGWWRGFRPELEFNYLTSDYDKITLSNGTTTTLSGKLAAYSAMANTFYDFAFGNWQPFVGVGFGVASNKKDSSTKTVGNRSVGEPSRSKTDFAAHADVGFNYRVTQNLLLGPSYRVLLINNGDATTYANYRYDDNHAHIFKLNARWHFNP